MSGNLEAVSSIRDYVTAVGSPITLGEVFVTDEPDTTRVGMGIDKEEHLTIADLPPEIAHTGQLASHFACRAVVIDPRSSAEFLDGESGVEGLTMIRARLHYNE